MDTPHKPFIKHGSIGNGSKILKYFTLRGESRLRQVILVAAVARVAFAPIGR